MTQTLRHRRLTLLGIAALALLLPAANARAEPPSGVQLPSAAKGAAAIAALGSHLPTVARAYGLEAQALSTLFRLQPSLGVDRNGALVYLCENQVASPSDIPLQVTSGAPGSYTADALRLHSLPGAPRVIYLDFNGHTTSGTSWNSSYKGGADIISAPFDQDGSPATFSAGELDVIRRIWQRVAEDFAPFAIDVTTEDPGLEGLRKSTSSDTTYGVRVVISPTNWYSTNAGGVAYIGSFAWSSDTPCYAFTAQLANGEKYIAECASHEAGHTLGLYHDGAGGASPVEYYGGQGTWAPIMGNSYYKSVTQFSRGEYANANNTQDDLTVISGYAPVLADDHGGTLSTATALAGPGVATGGTLERGNDVDVFRLNADAGTISLNIASPSPAPNADIKAELLDSAGTVLQASDPSGLSAAITYGATAGTYYLRLSPAGSGDPVSTGYSVYASIGDYVITGSFSSAADNQAPVARAAATPTSGVVPLTVSFTGAGSYDPDGTLASYLWDLGNGVTSSQPSLAHTFTTAGTYTATLTVTDNRGLSSTTSVVIAAQPPPNQLPVAVASATPASGVAPLPVTFSSTGSYDPDGSIAGYQWNFGDGTASTALAPSKTYSVPGSYSATLTVTDNRGGTASRSVTISVAADASLDVDVASFALAQKTAPRGKSAVATILVRDRSGRPASGIGVAVSWSGVVRGSSSGITDGDGRIVLESSATKKSGTVTATITGVTPKPGTLHDPSIAAEPMVRTLAF